MKNSKTANMTKLGRRFARRGSVRLAIIAVLPIVASVLPAARADAGIVQTWGGTTSTFMHWGRTAYAMDGQWCGRESLLHVPNVYVPCSPAIYRTGRTTTNAAWESVWSEVKGVEFNLRSWHSNTPMLSLTDVGPPQPAGVPGQGLINMWDSNLGGWCPAPCVVTLGRTSTGGNGPGAVGWLISNSDVTINNASGIPWDADATPPQTQPDAAHVSAGSIIAHEIGHAIGLNHPVTGPRAGNLMECITGTGDTNYPTMDGDTGDTLSWLYAKDWNTYGTPGVTKAC